MINDFVVPKHKDFARHFLHDVLNPQVEYLVECRDLCPATGNAVRWLKSEVIAVQPDTPEEEARADLCDKIDAYVDARARYAAAMIATNAAQHVPDAAQGSVVLTLGRHHLVERTLLAARAAGKRRFSVVVVDDAVEAAGGGGTGGAGTDMAAALAARGVDVSYAGDVSAAAVLVRGGVDLVLLGAQAVFANGNVYARAGTAEAALAAWRLGVKAVALCESVGASEKSVIDSLQYNELDPERHTAGCMRLLFDTTPARYLEHVITEFSESKTSVVSMGKRKDAF